MAASNQEEDRAVTAPPTPSAADEGGGSTGDAIVGSDAAESADEKKASPTSSSTPMSPEALPEQPSSRSSCPEVWTPPATITPPAILGNDRRRWKWTSAHAPTVANILVALATLALAFFTWRLATATQAAVFTAEKQTNKLVEEVEAVKSLAHTTEYMANSLARMVIEAEEQRKILAHAIVIQERQGGTLEAALETARQNLPAAVPFISRIRCGNWVEHAPGEERFRLLNVPQCRLLEIMLRNPSAAPIPAAGVITFNEFRGPSCPLVGPTELAPDQEVSYRVNLRSCLAGRQVDDQLSGRVLFRLSEVE